MRIAVDCMGGDHAPAAIIEGCKLALEADASMTLVLCGIGEKIRPLWPDAPADRVTWVDCPSVIETGESPTDAIRHKKDSSLIVAMDKVKAGEADAYVSAGSTGAVMGGALFHIGRIKGVLRPALAPVLPAMTGPALLIDCGANADCKPEYLVQFAMMGCAYCEKVLGIPSPRVALLNIGAEEEKGNILYKEVHQLLKATPGFIGNVEPREALMGHADVLVADGFAGNMVLKTLEGTAAYVMSIMKDTLLSGFRSKVGALLLKPALMGMRKRLDYTEYGGAVLLGVKAPVIKAHGSSNPKAFAAALKQAGTCAGEDVPGAITTALEETRA
ncbi:MAG: phosphate acyltransferase PlsX [Christensenellales bacterium]